MARVAIGALYSIVAGVTGYVVGACFLLAAFILPGWVVILGAVSATVGVAWPTVRLGAPRLAVAYYGAVVWLSALGMLVHFASSHGN